MTLNPGRHANVMLIEDNPGDVRLIMEALRDSAICLQVAQDGEKALNILRQEGPYVDAQHPDLILMDLNLPKMNGLELLKQIKADDALRPIPVVILSSSGSSDDVLKAYNLNANCYVTKPVELDDFTEMIRAIQDFWLDVVKLPPAREGIAHPAKASGPRSAEGASPRHESG